MNKLFTALMLCFVSIMAFGQDVAIINDENVEGYRRIQTEYTPMAKKGIGELLFSLKYYSPTGSDRAYYTLTFKLPLGTVNQSLPKGSKLYLKMDNDSIIVLETIAEIKDFENEYHYLPSYGGMYYNMYPTYSATPEQIEQLMQHRVIKTRTQTTWGEGYTDVPNGVLKEKHMCLTENLIRMKSSIDNRLKNAATQDDLLNGF